MMSRGREESTRKVSSDFSVSIVCSEVNAVHIDDRHLPFVTKLVACKYFSRSHTAILLERTKCCAWRRHNAAEKKHFSMALISSSKYVGRQSTLCRMLRCASSPGTRIMKHTT